MLYITGEKELIMDFSLLQLYAIIRFNISLNS